MTTLATPTEPTGTTLPRVGVRTATWAAVLFSRLLVMASAAAGALFAQNRSDATTFDALGLSRHLGSVGNVLAASMDRWDSIEYLTIAHHGYGTAGLTAYFPLYPLLIHAVGWLTRSYVLAGVLISAVAFAVALELLYRLAREELDEPVANAVVLLLAFAPLSLFFTAVYTESLFLALSVGTFYLARHDRLLLASLTASAASLTHIQGILLIVPLGYCWWERHGTSRSVRGLVRWQAAPLLLPFASLAGLCAFLHSEGFGWIAPISNETNPGWRHQFVGPVLGVIRALEAGVSGLWQTIHGAPMLMTTGAYPFSHSFQSLVYLLVLAICGAALLQAWKRLPRAYAVYSGLYLMAAGALAAPPNDPDRGSAPALLFLRIRTLGVHRLAMRPLEGRRVVGGHRPPTTLA